MPETKARVLIAEDKRELRELYLRQIEKLGLPASAAESGEEAWKRIQGGEAVDVVLTDISMPGSIDGVELVKRVKAERPSIDLIVMTAFPTLETAIQALKLGAYDYLSKPFSQDQLKLVLGRCLEKRRIEAELGEEKSLRRELEAAYSELRKIERLKDAFMARVSHELRTPLMAAAGVLELAETRLLEPEKGLIGKAQRSLGRLSEVVADLLTFSELLKGDRPRRSEPVNAGEAIRRQFEAYRPLFEQKEVRITLSIPDLPPVSGDPDLLESAFRHLVANAALFNKFQGTASVRAAPGDGWLHVEFENTGRDLPADQTERVFDSFYQLADDLTREVGGMGLGLAIVRKVIEAHGGTVRAKTRDGGGAVFFLDLPSVPPRPA